MQTTSVGGAASSFAVEAQTPYPRQGDQARHAGPLIVGTRKQLFFDDYVIEKLDGLRRTVHPAVKHNGGSPVLTPDKPWEGGHVFMYGSVLYNPQKKLYEMWYRCGFFPGQGLGYDVAYAYSFDGLNWTKPLLPDPPRIWQLQYFDALRVWPEESIWPYRDTNEIKARYRSLGKTNLVMAHQEVAGLVYTPDDPDPERQYKTSAFGGTLYYSPDGIQWKIGNTYYPGQGCWFNYDPARHLYFGYFIYPPYGVKAYDGTTRRVHGFSCSYDLVRWTGSNPEDIKIALPLCAEEIYAGYRKSIVRGKPVSTVEVVMVPDKRDDDHVPERTAYRRDVIPNGTKKVSQAHFNGLAVLPYEGVYIGFPALHAIYAKGPAGVGDIGSMQIEMAFSRDLRHWRRDDRTLVVPNGPADSFDAGACCVSNKPLLVGDEVWLYYGGKSWVKGFPAPLIEDRIKAFEQGKAGPPSGVGLAKWRLDGFISLDGGNSGGSLTTKLLIFAGRTLELNADALGGSIIVELLGPDRSVLPGFSLAECDSVRSDSVRHVVSWKGRSDLGLLAGKEVTLRIKLQNARLYAFRFVGEGPTPSEQCSAERTKAERPRAAMRGNV